MADREIFCSKCGTYVGTIRDAKLKKGLTFVCCECSEKAKQKEESSFGNIFGENFDNMFGGNFGKHKKNYF